VEDLYDRPNRIEVVSVLLRFVCPQEFGIISPPVASLLNLVPGDAHPRSCNRYPEVPGDLRRHYSGLDHVADVDMTLWSAAQLSFDQQSGHLTEAMNEDLYSQKIRLENLVAGLRGSRRWSDRYRVLFAAALLGHDYITPAAMVARPLEALVREVARRLNIQASPRRGESKVGALVR